MSSFWKFSKNGKHLKILLATGILLGSPLLAQAENPRTPMRLSPNEAVDLAIRNNLDLEAQRISTGTARRASNLAWNQLIPTVDVGATMYRLNTAPERIDLGIPGMPPMDFANRSGRTIHVTTALSFNFGKFAEMNKLRQDYKLGLITYNKARAQLERDTRKLYHNILLIQENIALLQGSLETADRQVQIAQVKLNAGIAAELTLLQARVARESLLPIIDQARNGLSLFRMQFSMFLGLPHDTEFELIPVATDMSPIPLDTMELISMAAAGQPDIQELRQSILIMNSIRQSNKHNMSTPTLSLGWTVDPTLGRSPFFERDMWSQQAEAFTMSVGFRLNWFLPFGTERQYIRSLNDQIRAANINLEQMIRGTEIEIHNLVQTLERIKLSIEALKQTVTLAERSFQLTEQAYRLGRSDVFQVQNAELSLRQARVQLSEQQFNYLNGLLDLEYMLGIPFGTLATP
jgi:outer membrane protein TolC